MIRYGFFSDSSIKMYFDVSSQTLRDSFRYSRRFLNRACNFLLLPTEITTEFHGNFAFPAALELTSILFLDNSPCRSTDTEDYMKIELAPSQSVCQEPPKPPPLPPNLMAATPNGDTVDAANASKTNTINSNNNTIATPQSQDTATRKQQQPLSSISIQDLNSVQVCTARVLQTKLLTANFLQLRFFPPSNFSATTHRQNGNKNLAANTKRKHAMLIVDQRSLSLAKN